MQKPGSQHFGQHIQLYAQRRRRNTDNQRDLQSAAGRDGKHGADDRTNPVIRYRSAAIPGQAQAHQLHGAANQKPHRRIAHDQARQQAQNHGFAAVFHDDLSHQHVVGYHGDCDKNQNDLNY